VWRAGGRSADVGDCSVVCHLHSTQISVKIKCFALLFTHAERHGVDLSFTVSLFVFLHVSTVTDFSAEDKCSCVKFCTAVNRCPRPHFCELCTPRNAKSARHVDVGLTCVDIGQTPR